MPAARWGGAEQGACLVDEVDARLGGQVAQQVEGPVQVVHGAHLPAHAVVEPARRCCCTRTPRQPTGLHRVRSAQLVCWGDGAAHARPKGGGGGTGAHSFRAPPGERHLPHAGPRGAVEGEPRGRAGKGRAQVLVRGPGGEALRLQPAHLCAQLRGHRAAGRKPPPGRPSGSVAP